MTVLFDKVVEWIFRLIKWVLDPVPVLPDPPQWLGQAQGPLVHILDQAQGLCSWVDFAMAKEAIVLLATFWVLIFTAKFLMMLAGLITRFG